MAKWIIDPDHSVAAFSIRHMTVAFVHGQLNDVSGTIVFDPDNDTGMKIEFKIGVSSIITGIKKRDDHLKSADFFDIEKFPEISFKSHKVRRTGDSRNRISGSLTIHGITKTVTLDIDVAGPAKSTSGETSIGITGNTILNREEFAITWNQPLQNNGVMVGKEVVISVDLEADLTDAG